MRVYRLLVAAHHTDILDLYGVPPTPKGPSHQKACFPEKLGPLGFPHPPAYFSLHPDRLTQLSIDSDHAYMILKNYDFPLLPKIENPDAISGR